MKKLLKISKKTWVSSSMYVKTDNQEVFMNLKVGEKEKKLKIKLFESQNPKSSENFKKICEGFKTKSGKNLSYKGKKFLNKMPGFFLETEKMEETIYNKNISNESYKIEFNKPGLIGMSRTDNLKMEESNSGFFISLNKMKNLDQYVAVGEVIEGLDFLKDNGFVEDDVFITDCGVEA